MSKVKEVETTTREVREGTSEATIEETISTLQVQVKEFTEKAEYFRVMALKAQGALEILSQLGPKDNGEGDK